MKLQVDQSDEVYAKDNSNITDELSINQNSDRKNQGRNSLKHSKRTNFVSSNIDATKYLVLDVETNGLSSKRDDLLSIAIYKPDTKDIYIKYFPLELNSRVLTTSINGITKKTLKDATSFTQMEFDDVADKYDLFNRTILTYGNLDERFIKEYMKRHKLSGFSNLRFYNFKHDIIASCFSEGNITKDNLCKLFSIKGVHSIHSADNDCILEWELFRNLNGGQLLITNNKVFLFNSKEYIVPASYISTYPNFKYHLPAIPKIVCHSEIVKKVTLRTNSLKKFNSNINGITLEHLINSMLQTIEIDSSSFLINNKAKLKYIGKLRSDVYTIPMVLKEDGTVRVNNSQDKAIETEINEFLNSLRDGLMPLISYIKSEVFMEKSISSQELVINKDSNILALCDLSSEDAILEIKMANYLDPSVYATQIFYEANGRIPYILQADWGEMPKEISFILSKLELSEFDSVSNHELLKEKKAREKIENDLVCVKEYINRNSPIILKCKKCNNEWSSSYLKAVRHEPCPHCYPSKHKKTNNSTTQNALTIEEKIQKNAEKYSAKILAQSNGLLKISGYVGSRYDVDVECLICGNKWTCRADHFADRCYCRFCHADYSK